MNDRLMEGICGVIWKITAFFVYMLFWLAFVFLIVYAFLNNVYTTSWLPVLCFIVRE